MPLIEANRTRSNPTVQLAVSSELPALAPTDYLIELEIASPATAPRYGAIAFGTVVSEGGGLFAGIAAIGFALWLVSIFS
jgi:hypothetical protein